MPFGVSSGGLAFNNTNYNNSNANTGDASHLSVYKGKGHANTAKNKSFQTVLVTKVKAPTRKQGKMKRLKNLYNLICTRENILQAYHKARAGKSCTYGVKVFECVLATGITDDVLAGRILNRLSELNKPSESDEQAAKAYSDLTAISVMVPNEYDAFLAGCQHVRNENAEIEALNTNDARDTLAVLKAEADEKAVIFAEWLQVCHYYWNSLLGRWVHKYNDSHTHRFTLGTSELLSSEEFLEYYEQRRRK